MTPDTYLGIAFWLSLAGVLFAGYLSAHRLVLKRCAFGESCPYVFGIPACFIGFLIFLALFVVGFLARHAAFPVDSAVTLIRGLSLAGVLYAGYLTLKEFGAWLFAGRTRTALVLPTCSYGLLVFALVYGLGFA